MSLTPLQQAELGIYTYGRLVPREAPPMSQYVIDVAGLRDPLSNRGFKHKYSDGRPGEVQDFVREDSRMNAILDTVKLIAHMQLRSMAGDGKWLSFGIRDHHGKWIAPAVGEILADELSRAGYKVALHHHDVGGQK